jgi:hypothetical protein
VCREKSKKLCDLCGLCERKGKCVSLSKILMAEIRTNHKKIVPTKKEKLPCKEKT